MSQQKLWDDKRYYSLPYYLKHEYGERIHKIALTMNNTCPNRDGTLLAFIYKAYA